MSKVAPWLALSTDWQDSEMFDDAPHGVRLAWICLLCFVKAQGRAGRARFRGKKFAENYRLSIEVVDEMLARAGMAEAVLIEGDSVTVVNWKSYQDPKARNRGIDKHQAVKGVRKNKRQFSKSTENDATKHPPPSTHHPPPPPAPLKLNPSAPDPEPLSESWLAVVDCLLSEGITAAEECCETAIAHEVRPHEAMGLIEHYRKHKQHWGAGALVSRFRSMRPGQSVFVLWPPLPAGVTTGYEQISAEEFRELGRKRQFKKTPIPHATIPNWVFGELRDGRKVECRNYPTKAAT